MIYQQLEKQYMDDAVVAALYGREAEHFHYQLNVDVYQATLDSLNPEDPRRADFEGRIEAEKTQQAVCERTYDALKVVAPKGEEFAAAVLRVSGKRAAMETK